MIIKYLKELSKKLFTLFSGITAVCGFIAFYYSKHDPSSVVAEFVTNNFLYVFILFFTISSYQVWKEAKLDLKQKDQALNEIRKNPVDYKIIAKIQKVDINLDRIRENYISQFSDVGNDIVNCNSELRFLENGYDSPLNKLTSINDIKFNMSMSKPKDEYISDLKEYKEKLENYKDRINSNIKEWKKFIKDDLKTIHTVSFSIESNGTKSDRNIDVEILLNSNRYINSLEDLESYPQILEKPKKPSSNNLSNLIIPNDYSRISSLLSQNHFNKDAFYKFKKLQEKILSINLREMNVGDNISIFKEKLLIDLPEKEEIKVIIKSENSNVKIEKLVEFKLEKESIEYFDYLNQLENKNE